MYSNVSSGAVSITEYFHSTKISVFGVCPEKYRKSSQAQHFDNMNPKKHILQNKLNQIWGQDQERRGT